MRRPLDPAARPEGGRSRRARSITAVFPSRGGDLLGPADRAGGLSVERRLHEPATDAASARKTRLFVVATAAKSHQRGDGTALTDQRSRTCPIEDPMTMTLFCHACSTELDVPLDGHIEAARAAAWSLVGRPTCGPCRVRAALAAGDLVSARQALHEARRAGVRGLYMLEVQLVAREVPGLDVAYGPRSREDAPGRARASAGKERAR